MLTYIPDSAVDQIASIGAKRAPREACGVLLPLCLDHNPPCDSVVELENQAIRARFTETATPDADPPGVRHYEVSGEQLADAVGNFYRNHPELLPQEVTDGFYLWHTHMPDGTEGPSVGDLRHRVSGIRYLVVRLSGSGRPSAVRY